MRAFFLTEKGVKLVHNHLEAWALGNKVDTYYLGEDIRELASPGSWHFVMFDVPVIRRPPGDTDLRAHVSGAVLARRPDEAIESFLEKFVGVWLSDEEGGEFAFVNGCKIESQPITLVKDLFCLGNMVVHYEGVRKIRSDECPELLRDQGTEERQAS